LEGRIWKVEFRGKMGAGRGKKMEVERRCKWEEKVAKVNIF